MVYAMPMATPPTQQMQNVPFCVPFACTPLRECSHFDRVPASCAPPYIPPSAAGETQPAQVEKRVQLGTKNPSRVTQPPHSRKGQKEGCYTVVALRRMLRAILSSKKVSARKAANDEHCPKAQRNLERWVKAIRADVTLQRSSQQDTLAAQLEHVLTWEQPQKGNAQVRDRRIFSEDELDYFARVLKVYGDMGWPMDREQIRDWFAETAKEKGVIDWQTGEPFRVSAAYVGDFLRSRVELREFKAAHIDPLRAKKATPKVCCLLAEWIRKYVVLLLHYDH